MPMNEDRFVGTAGSKKDLDAPLCDMKTEAEGKMKQATGAAQDLYGQGKDAAGDAYGQAGDAARSVQEHAAPMEEFLRNGIESRPYSPVAVLAPETLLQIDGLSSRSAAKQIVQVRHVRIFDQNPPDGSS